MGHRILGFQNTNYLRTGDTSGPISPWHLFEILTLWLGLCYSNWNQIAVPYLIPILRAIKGQCEYILWQSIPIKDDHRDACMRFFFCLCVCVCVFYNVPKIVYCWNSCDYVSETLLICVQIRAILHQWKVETVVDQLPGVINEQKWAFGGTSSYS
jgi:hypothetical protein